MGSEEKRKGEGKTLSLNVKSQKPTEMQDLTSCNNSGIFGEYEQEMEAST